MNRLLACHLAFFLFYFTVSNSAFAQTPDCSFTPNIASGNIFIGDADGFISVLPQSNFNIAGQYFIGVQLSASDTIGNLTTRFGATFTIEEPGEYEVYVSFTDDDNSCSVQSRTFITITEEIGGCIDPDAFNYNPEATQQRGACIYEDPCEVTITFSADRLTTNYIATHRDTLSASYKWRIADPFNLSDTTVLFGKEVTYTYRAFGDQYVSLEYIKADSSCSEIRTLTRTVASDSIPGCTDPNALNFYPFASQDDGSCRYGISGNISGCTDFNAINYNALANVENGSCQYVDSLIISGYIIPGCMDPGALNYSSLAQIDNGTCIFGQDSVLVPIELDEAEAITKEIVAENISNCDIDYSVLIDSVAIVNSVLEDSLVTITWEVYQSEDSYLVSSEIPLDTFDLSADNSNYLIFSSISCNTGAGRIAADEIVIRSLLTFSPPENVITNVEGEPTTDVRFFPNPFHNQLEVQFKAGSNVANSYLSIELFDLNGKLILRDKIRSDQSSVFIQTGHLPLGVYQLILRKDNKVELFRKLVKY
ncbi:MAG: T9SS type A sorting domain-containing protein [Bacteroidota bacterium]